MTIHEREKLWMAYLDGEMTSTEAAAFDESLTSEERSRLAGEMRLESGLAEALAAGALCPDAVWRRTELMLRNRSKVRARRLQGSWRLVVGALAASLLVGLSFWASVGVSSEAVFAIAAADMVEFAGYSEVAAEPAAIQAYLEEHEIDLALSSESAWSEHAGHAMHLLGARKMAGHDVVELLVSCCGFPAKVVLAGSGTSAARLIRDGAEAGEIQQTSPIGEFLAGVVSKHQTPELLELLRAAPEVVV